MFNRLLGALLAHKVKVKKYQCFKFTNQTSEAVYFFNNQGRIIKKFKCYHYTDQGFRRYAYKISNVSYNWLIWATDTDQIIRLNEYEKEYK